MLVSADLANRGVKDVLTVCCGGLTGFPDAIATMRSHTAVQTCAAKLSRNSMRFCVGAPVEKRLHSLCYSM